jgi:F0F1-type ATP synthase beta subunit
MAEKKSFKTDWHVLGGRVLLRAVRNHESKIIIAKSVAEQARSTYKFYVEEIGSNVPKELEVGSRVYLALPGLTSIEGTTDEEAPETFFFIDYNFIYLYNTKDKYNGK